MAEILKFPGNEDGAPHTAGPWVCLSCEHEWVAVAPTGTDYGECPSCHLMKGVKIGLCLPETTFVCKCGGMFFAGATSGLICIACGTVHNPFDVYAPEGGFCV
jgi:hypothetical protein